MLLACFEFVVWLL